MSCCLASSRENTTIFFGRPISPVSKRRTRALPNDPVPPVTSTRLPSRTTSPPPRLVGRWILRHRLDHPRPGWWNIPRSRPEPVRIQAPVNIVMGNRLNLNRDLEGLPQQTEQLMLA